MTTQGWRIRVAVGICLGGALLALLSLVFVVVGNEWWRTLFAVTSEQNMPTWYSGSVLLVVGLVALVVGGLAVRSDVALARRWWLLAGVFVVLSIDELVSLHEQLGAVVAGLGEPGGLLHFTWVLPGLVVAALVTVAVLQLARRLPVVARREMVCGVGIFLGAAIGLEMIGGLVLDTVGTGWTYQIVSTTEEFAEIIGAAVVLHAILRTVELSAARAGVALRYVPA